MNYLIISGLKQNVNYYLLPKKQNDRLLINTPLIIYEPVSEWINNKTKLNVHFLFGSSRFTFMGAYVNERRIFKNRYDIESRDLTIKFDMMLYGHKSIL